MEHWTCECPLSMGFNPAKRRLCPIKNKGHLGSRYVYVYIYIYTQLPNLLIGGKCLAVSCSNLNVHARRKIHERNYRFRDIIRHRDPSPEVACKELVKWQNVTCFSFQPLREPLISNQSHCDSRNPSNQKTKTQNSPMKKTIKVSTHLGEKYIKTTTAMWCFWCDRSKINLPNHSQPWGVPTSRVPEDRGLGWWCCCFRKKCQGFTSKHHHHHHHHQQQQQQQHDDDKYW